MFALRDQASHTGKDCFYRHGQNRGTYRFFRWTYYASQTDFRRNPDPEKIISRDQLQEAERTGRTSGMKVHEALVRLGYAPAKR